MHNRILTSDPGAGELATLAQLSSRYGVHESTLYSRYLAGWRGKRLVAKPERGGLSDAERDLMALQQRASYIKGAKNTALARPMSNLAGE